MKTAFLIISLSLFCTCIIGQDFPDNHEIDVNIRLIEQLKGSVRSLPNIPFRLVGVGECIANEKGVCNFKVPIAQSNRFEITIDIEDYQIIKPLEGKMLLDTNHLSLKLEVIVIGADLEERYKSKIETLQKELLRIKKANHLSQHRLNAMNTSLLNKIKEGEEQQLKLDRIIVQLKMTAQADSLENEKLTAALHKTQQELNLLSQTLDSTQTQLTLALEEKYLRQQNYLNTISADLMDYLIRAKDACQLLKEVREYFPGRNNPEYVATYNSTLDAYNNILIKLNEQHLDYIQNVQHYWQNPEIAGQLRATFDQLFNSVHYPQLQPAFSDINTFIRRNQPKKAAKSGKKANVVLEPLIADLEFSIHQILSELEYNFE